MDKLSFEIPTRQSPIGVFIILLKFLRVAIRQILPIVLIYIIKPGGNMGYWIELALIGFGIFYVIRSILYYLRFYFYIQNDELVIEKGILKRTKISIPLDRIQSVNFEQNIVHQIFSVVQVKADTAGSSGDEAEIPALGKDMAEALRTHVLEYKAEHGASAVIAEDGTVVVTPDKLLFQRTPGDLLKVGLGANHLRTLLIIVGFVASFARQIGEWLNIGQEDVEQFLLNSVGIKLETILSGLLVMIPTLIVGGLIFSILFSMVRTVIRYFDLKLWRTEQGFKAKAGLLTRHEQAAVLQKIQLVRWGANPLMIALKILSIRLFQASSARTSRRDAIRLPGSTEGNLEQVLEITFPGDLREGLTWHGITTHVINRRMLYMGLLPLVIVIPLAYLQISFSALWLLLWLPFTLWTSIRYQRRWRYGLNGDVLQTRSGIFGHRNTLLQLFKVMAVRIKQTPYQQRKDVANLVLFTAAGKVEIPYIKLEIARQLQDYVLYRVEVDEREWM